MSARYHGHERVVCPHALGWKDRRAKLLAYQVAGTTSAGVLPAGAGQRWRSMFVDEIEDAVITEGRWQSAPNYRDEPRRIGMDVVEVGLAAAPTLLGETTCG